MTKNSGNSTDNIKTHHLLLLVTLSIILGALCLVLAAVVFVPAIGGQSARLAPALMKSSEDYPVPDLPPAPPSGSIVTITLSPSGQTIGESVRRIVTQGDRVRVDAPGESEGSYCTIGYVQTATAVAYTAGHCGDDGADVFNEQGDAIGVFRHSPSYTGGTGPGDVGYILLDDDVEVGANHYSGDGIVTGIAGSEICAYGATSKKVICGELIAHRNDAVGLIHINIPVTGGDSGGPVWIPGRGVIGTIGFDYANSHTPLPVTGVTTFDASALAAATVDRTISPPTR